jgi:chromosome segregation ATPase
MTDITELQARITAALDRIGSGLESLSRAAAADSDEVSGLKEALEEERTANAQLEERVRAIKARQDDTVEKLAAEVDRLRGQLETEETAVARLMRVNAELRRNNAALRGAISEGVAEPHLVNKSMMTELEALRAAQAADRAELDAVLGELGPLMAEARDLGGLGREAGMGEEASDA